MRQALVVLFWLWFALAVGVYGYRLWRRVTQGPKAEREAETAAREGRAVGLGERFSAPVAPLPDGPLQPRLPRSLADVGPPAGASAASPTVTNRPGSDPTLDTPSTPSIPTSPPAARDPRSGATPVGRAAPTARPTVAEALRGIDLPCDLVPVVDGDDADVTAGYKVTFATREASVRSVVAGLADELERLGYTVDDTPLGEGGEHRLRATREPMVVGLVVRAEESGAVVVDVTT